MSEPILRERADVPFRAAMSLARTGTLLTRCATVALCLCYLAAAAAQIAISPPSLPDGVVNKPYSQTLTGSGCVGACMWSSSGSLPTGLALNSNTGQISGTPTAAGTFQFTALVTDGNLDSGSQAYTIGIHTPPVITTTTLPGGMVGNPYSQSVGAANGTPPYSFSITSGALPAGLALNPSTGGISGTPTVAGSSTFTVTVTDSMNAAASQGFTISIAPAIPPVSITTSSLPAGTVGTPYSQTLAASGGTPPYSWLIAGGALPAGISLNPSTGQLSGTPTNPGSSGFTVQVTDSRGARALANLGIPVGAPPLNITNPPPPPATLGSAYSAAFTGTGGILPYSWNITAGGLPPGISLNGSTGSLSGSPTQRGVFTFTVQLGDNGGDTPVTAQFSITVAPPKLVITTSSPFPAGTAGQPYGASLAASGGVPPYTWSITSGSLPDGLQLNGSAGAIGGTPSSPGTSTFTAQVSDSTNAHTSAPFSISIGAPKLVISTTSLPPGTQGVPYSQTLSAAGGVPPYTWSLNSGTLPPGLALYVIGSISGVTGATGTFQVGAAVTDSAGTSTSVSLTLVITGPKLTITTASPIPNATLSAPYSQTLAAAGGSPPYSWSIQSGSLPPGLALNASGVISGTPTALGPSTFTAQVSDAANTNVSAQFSLTVAPGTLTISSASSLPTATLGVAYSLNLTATGGAPPYTWSVTTGTLPAGLNLSGTSGAISGTATIVGSFTFNLRVTDRLGATADNLETILVSAEPPPPPTVTLSQMPPTANSAAQIPVDLALSASYSQPVSGQITLTFQPDAAAPKDDPAIQFSNGSRTATFTVPAGSTRAIFGGSTLALQTGSVAGTINLAVTANLPNTNLSSAITVARAAPVISSAAVVRGASGFQVQISGFSNSRDLSGAQFHFTAAAGQALQTGDLSVDLHTASTQWFTGSASAPFGGQFLVVVPFTLSAGSVANLSSVSVQLQNAQGSSASSSAGF